MIKNASNFATSIERTYGHLDQYRRLNTPLFSDVAGRQHARTIPYLQPAGTSFNVLTSNIDVWKGSWSFTPYHRQLYINSQAAISCGYNGRSTYDSDWPCYTMICIHIVRPSLQMSCRSWITNSREVAVALEKINTELCVVSCHPFLWFCLRST